MTNDEEFDEVAPYVCPGCYAVSRERCAPGCIDAAIAADQENDFNDEEGPYVDEEP